ncbi:MAG TPA: sigma-54 dependent transcriptional regulator [Pyrinomonadaceae bacterium]|jgi:DNA-binding NtrC family response regulator
MNDEKFLVLDLHPRNDLGIALQEILSPCQKQGVTVCYERVLDGDVQTTAETHGLTFIEEHRPALVSLIISNQQLSFAVRLAQSCRERSLDATLVVVVEAGEPSELFELLQHGVNDFIVPPLKAVDILPRVWRSLEHARRSKTLLHRLKEKMGRRQIVGESEGFLSEVNRIPLVARCDASVLITGETGTGKELCARAIHYLGPRADQPFVPVNCGAIPNELVENELFGHERGAFTGAIRQQVGLVREAEGGTLFLDEIDCMPLHAQVKLLRFLQEKEYRPLGSAKTMKADVRVIAASNNDCEESVRAGKLRQDLFYRLNVIPLKLPPLRERRDDIPLLACHFLEKYAAQFGHDGIVLAADALLALSRRDWPGNVRELENVVERAVALTEQDVITSESLGLPPVEAAGHEPSFKEAKISFIAQFERTYIQKLLVAYQGNITKAAQAAHKNRRAFWQLIRKYQIDVQSFKSSLQPK